MIRAHFTLPCLYLAQKKIVDRLNIPSLLMSLSAVLWSYQYHQQTILPFGARCQHEIRGQTYNVDYKIEN
jgi:hypothetical protein